jgi:probable blue pigment (indigoidine) exporter
VGTSNRSLTAFVDRDLGLLILLGVIWGAAFPVIRLGLVAGAAPFPFATIRLALAAVILAGIAAASKEVFPERRALLLSMLFGGGLMLGGYMGFVYWGEGTTPGGLSAVLVGSAPIWSALLAYYVLPSERFSWKGSVGVVVGFGGLIVLFLPDLTSHAAGPLAAALALVGAALAFAIGSVSLRRALATAQGLWALAAQFAVGAAILSVVSIGVGSPLALPWNLDVLVSLAYLVGISSVLGYWIYFRLHHRVGPARANVVAYVNPLAGIAVGVLLLGEGVGFFEAAGFLLILVGLYLLHRDRLRPSAPSRPATAVVVRSVDRTTAR